MKKYRLLKEFPSSKVGDIWELFDDGFLSPVKNQNVAIHRQLFKPFDEWFEECEEPKNYWYIDCDGYVMIDDLEPATTKKCMELGNYFETKEEAEQAVEKLKAWKRLKDEGFKFFGYDDGYKHDFNSGHIEFYIKDSGAVLNDLDLLFGGED